MFDDDVKYAPFDTQNLYDNLTAFLRTPFNGKPIGDYRYGVYAFFDYDMEPIYVGQTREKLGVRIRRHLTNQRTDAVAMSVLDPYEVFVIRAWPLGEYDSVRAGALKEEACAKLNALESAVYNQAIRESRFNAVLNEKAPPIATVHIESRNYAEGCLVSQDVHAIRKHPDFRIARRALVLSRLAQVISERRVSPGLRQTLLTQAKRLQWLAERRAYHMSQSDNPSPEEEEEI